MSCFSLSFQDPETKSAPLAQHQQPHHLSLRGGLYQDRNQVLETPPTNKISKQKNKNSRKEHRTQLEPDWEHSDMQSCAKISKEKKKHARL